MIPTGSEKDRNVSDWGVGPNAEGVESWTGR